MVPSIFLLLVMWLVTVNLASMDKEKWAACCVRHGHTLDTAVCVFMELGMAIGQGRVKSGVPCPRPVPFLVRETMNSLQNYAFLPSPLLIEENVALFISQFLPSLFLSLSLSLSLCIATYLILATDNPLVAPSHLFRDRR